MRKYVSMFILICGLFGSVAQSQHDHHPPKVVDGKDHPEQIKDRDAYRMVFLALGANKSEGLTQTQQINLTLAGLTEPNILTASIVLNDFKERFDTLVNQYNKSEDVKNMSNAGQKLFRVKRDLLVQYTRDTLKMSLSPDGMTAFDNYVRNEKIHMSRIGDEEEN